MSWLFAVLIPGLLMLATFGLQRLESGLVTGSDTEDAFAELVLATPPRVDRAPRAAVAAASFVPSSSLPVLDNEPGLPTRLCRREVANPQFQATRHANPV
ncbi:MAG: hypothetical protein HYZ38_03065 [Mycobacterium sp.]|nr:hypothetical protein [Mycobacterium sp.]